MGGTSSFGGMLSIFLQIFLVSQLLLAVQCKHLREEAKKAEKIVYESCNTAYDFVLLIDTSGPLDSSHERSVKIFVKDFLDTVPNGENGPNKVSIITYGDAVQLYYSFQHTMEVNEITHMSFGGNTISPRVTDALDMVEQQFNFVKNNLKSNRSQILIVLAHMKFAESSNDLKFEFSRLLVSTQVEKIIPIAMNNAALEEQFLQIATQSTNLTVTSCMKSFAQPLSELIHEYCDSIANPSLCGVICNFTREKPHGHHVIHHYRGPSGKTGAPGSDGEDGITGAKGDTGMRGPQGEMGEPGPKGDQGVPGKTGVIGEMGPPGVRGFTGFTGHTGPTGEPGRMGPQGNTGSTGQVGPPGLKGDQGLRGDTGRDGKPGETGAAGKDGLPGRDGLDGSHGEPGRDGEKGETGATGPQGIPGNKGDRGEKGDAGSIGLSGFTGHTGPTGNPGSQGAQGPKGDPGSKGLTGATGHTGVAGNTGNTGPPGPTGLAGKTGSTGEKGPAGLPGKTGATGETGPIGPPGSRGMDGSNGLDGRDGKPGEQGETGNTGPQGNTGITGARGSTGVTGVKGDMGWTGLRGLDGRPGEPGRDGQVGHTGFTGPMGPAGAPGSQGPRGFSGNDSNLIVIANCPCREGELCVTHLGDPYPYCLPVVPNCGINNGYCDHDCTMEFNGRVQCTCRNGFHLLPDSRSCEDVDECVGGLHKCSCASKCVNTMGSYICWESTIRDIHPIPPPITSGCGKNKRDIDSKTVAQVTSENTFLVVVAVLICYLAIIVVVAWIFVHKSNNESNFTRVARIVDGMREELESIRSVSRL